MSALVVDIETIGEDWEEIDEHTQELLKNRLNFLHPEWDEEKKLSFAKEELASTPFTGRIIALGLLDCETRRGAVYYQAPSQAKDEEKEKNGIKFKIVNEKELLENFWKAADRYSHFITFSGRTFDMPYIMLRSAIHEIRPKKDLMKNRYLNYQAPNAFHIDLFDQLNFYGSFPRLGGLHLACRAFGIDTPKDGEIDGSKVAKYFNQGEYFKIAEYNARDLFATADLYQKWQKTLAF